MSEFDKVLDSGQREEFSTGSRRDICDGKGRFVLLPPYAIFRLARHYENGGRKYGLRNWEAGQPLSRYLDSAMRHLFKFLAGFRDEDHLSACSWNCLAIVETQKRIELGLLPKELDDLPPVISEKTANWSGTEESESEESVNALREN